VRLPSFLLFLFFFLITIFQDFGVIRFFQAERFFAHDTIREGRPLKGRAHLIPRSSFFPLAVSMHFYILPELREQIHVLSFFWAFSSPVCQRCSLGIPSPPPKINLSITSCVRFVSSIAAHAQLSVAAFGSNMGRGGGLFFFTADLCC